MARNVFFSFNFKRDAERVSQVRNMGVVSGQPLLTANQWEDVKKGGDKAIKQWINDQMRGKSCAVVLVGYGTAGRPWVEYEIEKAWKDGKGLVGIHIHNLKNLAGEQSAKGANPFSGFNIAGTPLSTIVKTYDPPHKTSTNVYKDIQNGIEGWVEEAITIRGSYT